MKHFGGSFAYLSYDLWLIFSDYLVYMFEQVQFTIYSLFMSQEWDQFPIYQSSEHPNKRNYSQKFSQSISISKEAPSNYKGSEYIDQNKGKTKAKQSQRQRKKPKRIKDPSKRSKMGRPPNFKMNNIEIQKQFLVQSKSFNDIFYHFSRMGCLLVLKKENQNFPHTLQLQNYQSEWMSKAEHIMSLQNFPSYNQKYTIKYTLHPNSLHFVFQYLKNNENKTNYYQQQVKYMLFAYLAKNKILTSAVHNYVNEYWNDVVYLINNPDDDIQQECQIYIQDQVMDHFQSKKMQNNENINRDNYNIIDKSSESKSIKQKRKPKKQNSEIQLLRKQLKEDDSIAAYQIACYLYACCIKYGIKIYPSS